MIHPSVMKMWNQFVSMNEDVDQDASFSPWHFCIDEEDANNLAQLVKRGVKTATSSLHILYDLENEPLPTVGDYNIITNYKGVAQTITKTINVNVLPFKKVDCEFARKEGEGDLSLEYWRKVHTDFFTKELALLNKEFDEEMIVVCEEFVVVAK
ncbi:ASCH domain-containing protein [Rossellomorea aquimaris]|uniref:ASCH domain-containing protein n=1 Tax=Rossellomorea aquimaris TaxID=189382 RepID=UPI0007D045DF|nr:ASCH domain-containing protein [Rossellomorea aquimaris]